jgi:hypothetical protein
MDLAQREDRIRFIGSLTDEALKESARDCHDFIASLALLRSWILPRMRTC